MTYIWTDTATIQNYLAAGSRITIHVPTDETPDAPSDEVSEGSAQAFENEAVDEITTILSAAWSGVYDLDSTTASRTLKWMAAKLAAASIGIVSVGGSGGDIPTWALQYRTDVLGQVSRMVINHETVEMPASCQLRPDLDLGELLLKVKLRAGEAVPDV